MQLLEREHIDTVPLLFANLNLLTNALPIATHTTLMNYRQLLAVSFPEPQQPSGPMHAHTPPRAALASLRSDTAAHNPRALRNQDSDEASPRKVTEWWLARNGEHHDGVGADADLRADPVEVIAHRSSPGLAPSVYQATPMQDTLLCGEWESHSGAGKGAQGRARSWHDARAQARKKSKDAEDTDSALSAYHYQCGGAMLPAEHQTTTMVVSPEQGVAIPPYSQQQVTGIPMSEQMPSPCGTGPSPSHHRVNIKQHQCYNQAINMPGQQANMQPHTSIGEAIAAQLATMQEAAREESKIVSELMEMRLVWLTQLGFTGSTLTLAGFWLAADSKDKGAFVTTMLT